MGQADNWDLSRVLPFLFLGNSDLSKKQFRSQVPNKMASKKVEAWQFEAFFALVIITNSVFIGAAWRIIFWLPKRYPLKKGGCMGIPHLTHPRMRFFVGIYIYNHIYYIYTHYTYIYICFRVYGWFGLVLSKGRRWAWSLIEIQGGSLGKVPCCLQCYNSSQGSGNGKARDFGCGYHFTLTSTGSGKKHTGKRIHDNPMRDWVETMSLNEALYI